jgi:hypothetical protein
MAFVQSLWTDLAMQVNTAASPLVVPLPPGAASGHVVWVNLVQNETGQGGNGYTDANPNTPTGWTGSGGRYRRVLDGSEGGIVTFTWAAGSGRSYGGASATEWTVDDVSAPSIVGGSTNVGTDPRTVTFALANSGVVDDYGALYWGKVETNDASQASVPDPVMNLATLVASDLYTVYSHVSGVFTKTKMGLWYVASYTTHGSIMPPDVFYHYNTPASINTFTGERIYYPSPLEPVVVGGDSDAWGWAG